MGCSAVSPKPYYVRDFCTYIKEVSSHAAAMTHLVPIGSLGTRIVEVARQAAVVTVLTGALSGKVAVGSTKEAGHQLLFSPKDTTHISSSRPSWEMSGIWINVVTDLRRRAVLGKMSILVAVSALDILACVISVWHLRNNCPCTFVFVIDLSLKHSTHQLYPHRHRKSFFLRWCPYWQQIRDYW